MSSTLGFTELNKVTESFSTRRRKNRTIKKTKQTNKVAEFLKGMDEDEDTLANFNPAPVPGDGLPKPELTKQPDPIIETTPDSDVAVGPEGFSKLDTNEASNLNYQNYYNTYVPYYSKPTNQANLHGSKDELMKKLNYMVHLLEENKDEKTQNVTEELVLYMFLGVFTIFVVDSFARAGKYTR